MLLLFKLSNTVQKKENFCFSLSIYIMRERLSDFTSCKLRIVCSRNAPIIESARGQMF
jgi:hypothetical protein